MTHSIKSSCKNAEMGIDSTYCNCVNMQGSKRLVRSVLKNALNLLFSRIISEGCGSVRMGFVPSVPRMAWGFILP